MTYKPAILRPRKAAPIYDSEGALVRHLALGAVSKATRKTPEADLQKAVIDSETKRLSRDISDKKPIEAPTR